MKRIAIYPGTFNPWHKGNDDILSKALLVFDKIIVAAQWAPQIGLQLPSNQLQDCFNSNHGKNKGKYLSWNDDEAVILRVRNAGIVADIVREGDIAK